MAQPSEPAPQEPRPAAGLRFVDWDFAVEPAEQADKLACCGVPAALYGSDIDPTHLANAAILHMRRAGFSINGNLHVGHVFALDLPLPLGVPLSMRGEVAQVTATAKGEETLSRHAVRLPDGRTALRMELLGLRLDPAAAANAGGAPGARQPETVPAEARELRRHRLRPEAVARYSAEAENLIHSDPEAARAFGFRAPIAGGLMAVRLLMASLAERGRLERLHLAVRFRRPMFWDEELRVLAAPDLGTLHVLKEDGRIAVTATRRV